MTKRWADIVGEEGGVRDSETARRQKHHGHNSRPKSVDRGQRGDSSSILCFGLERGALLEEAASHVNSWFFVRVAADFAN